MMLNNIHFFPKTRTRFPNSNPTSATNIAFLWGSVLPSENETIEAEVFKGTSRSKTLWLDHTMTRSQVWKPGLSSVQFSSVAQSCPTLCDPMNHSTPGLPVHHQLPESTQTHVHRVSDAIQPSHPLSSPSPPAPNPSQHQSLFQRVSSSHEVAKVLEFQF